MSNLGAYQWITSTSKKVRGPINLLLLTATTGAAFGKISEFCVKKCIKALKTHQATKAKGLKVKENIYSITSHETSDEGVEFTIGTKIKVLGIDSDSVLIEKIGDENNPYFVSKEFLRTISNFKE